MNLVEILNKKTLITDQISLAVSEERIEDARRLEGQVQILDEMAKEAAEAQEEALHRAQAIKTKENAPKHPKSMAEAILGTKDAFGGLSENFRAQAVSISDPTIEETSVPSWGEPPFLSFAGSIAQGTTTGDIKYLRRKRRKNAAGIWTPGKQVPDDKPQSEFEWEKVTAQLEIIAHHVPIEKPTLTRYGELQSIIENELSIGLYEAKDAHVLVGTNINGIQGVLKEPGIQKHVASDKDHVVDSIRKMVTKCVMKSYLYPNMVVMAPQVKEAIDLLKDTTGAYLTLMIGGKVWNIPVIEDINLIVPETANNKTTLHYGMMVYYTSAATLFSTGQRSIEVGYHSKQFIQNQLTILAEEENALKISYPDAFVYCPDAIPAGTVS